MSWTEKQVVDAMRAAIRIALAARRGDLAAIRRQVRDAASHELLVFEMARLPGVMIAAVGARDGVTLDPEEVLSSLLDEYPDVIDPREN